MSKNNNQKKNYTPAYNRGSQGKQQSKKPQKSGGGVTAILKSRPFITLTSVILALILVLTLSLVFAKYVPPYYKELSNDASTTETSSETLKNGNFNFLKSTSSTLQYPYAPQNWTLTSQSAEDNFTGVVSRSNEEKSKVETNLRGLNIPQNYINVVFGDYPNTTDFPVYDPEDEDPLNVMMFYNNINNSTGSYAYAVSEGFSISAGRFAAISVCVKTLGDGNGYIKLKTSATTTNSELKFSFSTNGVWEIKTFYIESNSSASQTLYMEIGYGETDSKAKGIAIFDDATIKNINKAAFVEVYLANEAHALDTNHKQVKSYNEALTDEGYSFFDTSFSMGSPYNPASVLDQTNPDNDDLFNALPFFPLDSTTNTYRDILSINNPTSSSNQSVSFGFKGMFTIEKSTAAKYYRISFWVKTDSINYESGAYVYLNVLNMDGSVNREKSKFFQAIKTSTDEDDVFSGWENYNIYIKPSNTASYTADLIFSLGKYMPSAMDIKTTGSLYVTELEMFEIQSQDFVRATSGGTTQKADLSDGNTSTGLIGNGDFNNPVNQATASSSLGLHPASWNMRYVPIGDTGTFYENVNYGIVPNDSYDLAKGIYFPSSTTQADLFSHTGNDSIFSMMITDNPGTFGIVSESLSFNVNSRYLISVLVQSNALDLVTVKLSGKDELVYTGAQLNSIDTSSTDYYKVNYASQNYGGFTRVNFVIYTGELAVTGVRLELWLGSKDELAPAGTYLAVDEAKTSMITDTVYDEFSEEEDNVFTVNYIDADGNSTDKDGNPIDKENAADIILVANKTNVIGRDFTIRDIAEDEEEDDHDHDHDNDDDNDVPKEPINWAYLGSIIFGGILIVVVAIFLIRKLLKNKTKEPVEYDDTYKR